ncbi:hypothetical protein BC827DRAFT_81458 [Russula dissimulans]|nr:hypothetical protein BC827DRAFT_81458 [Russula dissimulans]
MSSASVPSTDDSVIHGLNYPPDFLSSLPVLLPRPAPHTPIRALTASQFATIHRTATTSHAPDHVLFPFLHGLEGDNEQQKAFFSVTSDTPVISPRFRGLLWVACEEDDTPSDDDGDDSDVIASDDSDDDEPGSDVGDMGHSFALDMDMDMDTDQDLDRSQRQGAPNSLPSTSPSLGLVDPICDASDPDSAPHMHPVQSRAPRIYTKTALARGRSVSASTSSSSSFQSLSIPTPPTPATSLDLDSPPSSCTPLEPPFPEPQPRIAPLIASGFKTRDLLQLNSDGNAEFIPLKVPDGISLRNFDTQLVRILLSLVVLPLGRGLCHSSPPLFHLERGVGRLHYPR